MRLTMECLEIALGRLQHANQSTSVSECLRLLVLAEIWLKRAASAAKLAQDRAAGRETD